MSSGLGLRYIYRRKHISRHITAYMYRYQLMPWRKGDGSDWSSSCIRSAWHGPERQPDSCKAAYVARRCQRRQLSLGDGQDAGTTERGVFPACWRAQGEHITKGYLWNQKYTERKAELDSPGADGKLTAQAVVDAAREESSPLHGYFEWDDNSCCKRVIYNLYT